MEMFEVGQAWDFEVAPNGGVDAAARNQIDSRQLEIGNVVTLPPLASNDLLCRVGSIR
jgi:hypothetical protein